MKHFYLLLILVSGISFAQPTAPCEMEEGGVDMPSGAYQFCAIGLRMFSTQPANGFAVFDVYNWFTKKPFGTANQFVKADGTYSTILTDLNQFTNTPGYISGINSPMVISALGYTPYNATNPMGYVNQLGARSAISLTTTGSGAATYNSATGVLNVPTPATSVISTSSVTRSLNTSYQVSTTKAARVNYSVTSTIGLTLLLASGSVNVYLETSPNNTTWTVACQTGFSKSVAVAVAVSDAVTGNLYADVPAGYYVRIRTAATGGGLLSSVPNVTFTAGQETY